MQIRITRGTVARPTGEMPRMVDIGEVLEVDDSQASLLVGVRRAELFAGPMETAAVEPRAEQAVMPRGKPRTGG